MSVSAAISVQLALLIAVSIDVGNIVKRQSIACYLYLLLSIMSLPCHFLCIYNF